MPASAAARRRPRTPPVRPLLRRNRNRTSRRLRRRSCSRTPRTDEHERTTRSASPRSCPSPGTSARRVRSWTRRSRASRRLTFAWRASRRTRRRFRSRRTRWFASPPVRECARSPSTSSTRDTGRRTRPGFTSGRACRGTRRASPSCSPAPPAPTPRRLRFQRRPKAVVSRRSWRRVTGRSSGTCSWTSPWMRVFCARASAWTRRRTSRRTAPSRGSPRTSSTPCSRTGAGAPGSC